MSKSKRKPWRSSTRQRERRRHPLRGANKAALLQLWDWLLCVPLLVGIDLHGNTRWTARVLVIQALCWSWSDQRHLNDAFAQSVRWTRDLCGMAALTSYQGFMGALGTWSPTLIRELCASIHQRMAGLGSRFWSIGVWVPIAFDGSRVSTPRTQANEGAFCAPKHGQGKTAKYRQKKTKDMRRKNNEKNKPQPPKPQVWLTQIWHVGLRLVWSWRRGPSNACEREHVMDMVKTETFPKNTLFLGDAGFVGYPLWSRIVRRRYEFLVRVGGNVHLLVEGKVSGSKDQQVLSWPKDAREKGWRPLRLRLVRVRISKRTKAWLLTSVLDPKKLTVQQMVHLYKMRWGVEVEFRGLKQTLSRAKLRCHNDKRALLELDWSLVGLLVAQLWALKEQLEKHVNKPRSKASGMEYDPKKRSLAGTMRALRQSLDDVGRVAQPGPSPSVSERLGKAMTDDYVRTRPKSARYRPPNPDKKPLGDPKIRRLNNEERNILDAMPALSW